jgi:3-oxoacyl-[acyl-carrier-protein] synthase I
VFAGGSEEEHWNLSSMFDAMGALSTGYNDTPAKASRPYDSARDGFVSAAGAGMVVVEEYEHAMARGAKIYAELVGYGATSDGYDMVAPSGEGAQRCMRLAKSTVDARIDYINTHGTSTPVGDVKELEGIRAVFGDDLPYFGSSKSMCGHSLGATGAQEAIHCLLMLENDFIAPSINVEDPDPEVEGMPLVTKTIENAGIKTAMSNSFGFGGTNATLVFQKL